MPGKRPTNAEHLLSRVRELGKGCWEWTGKKNSKGYGGVGFRGKNWRVNRVAWILFKGEEIPEGMMVCHSCDNPSCINPKHLFLGTALDNNRDMMEKGRWKPRVCAAVVRARKMQEPPSELTPAFST